MFCSHSSDEAQHAAIILQEILILFLMKIHIDSGFNTGDTVEDGLGEICFPLALPGMYDILIMEFLGVDGLICGYLCPDFLLVHGENVEGLVKFHSLARSDFCHVILVYHNRYLYIISYSILRYWQTSSNNVYIFVLYSLFIVIL